VSRQNPGKKEIKIYLFSNLTEDMTGGYSFFKVDVSIKELRLAQ